MTNPQTTLEMLKEIESYAMHQDCKGEPRYRLCADMRYLLMQIGKLKRETAYMCQDNHGKIYHKDSEWCPLCRALGEIEELKRQKEVAVEALDEAKVHNIGLICDHVKDVKRKCNCPHRILEEGLSQLLPS